jgi:hypothetical protein
MSDRIESFRDLNVYKLVLFYVGCAQHTIIKKVGTAHPTAVFRPRLLGFVIPHRLGNKAIDIVDSR